MVLVSIRKFSVGVALPPVLLRQLVDCALYPVASSNYSFEAAYYPDLRQAEFRAVRLGHQFQISRHISLR